MDWPFAPGTESVLESEYIHENLKLDGSVLSRDWERNFPSS